MAIITQIAPLLDTVVSGLSASYSNQLEVSGAIGSVIYETTQPSLDVIVFPDGLVESTGVLADGVYVVSGTVSDLFGNSGVWSFKLTVTGPYTPQTTIVPVIAVEPTGIEIMVPFQIDPATGGVAFLSDYLQIIQQHVATICMTNANERLMNLNYGGNVEGQLFNGTNVQATTFASDLAGAITREEPSVTVQNVSVEYVPGSLTTVSVTIDYTIAPYNQTNTVTVTAGGALSQVAAL